MNEFVEKFSGNFVEEIKTIIGHARAQAVRSVEFHRVEMYWKLGEQIYPIVNALRSQLNWMQYERLLLSADKEAVLDEIKNEIGEGWIRYE